MKKALNGKNNKLGLKKIIIIITIFIFVFFIVSTLITIDRKYFFIEKAFKNISSNLNRNILNRMYNEDECIGNNNYLSKIKQLEKENNELKEIINLKSTNTNYLTEYVIGRSNYNFYNKLEITNTNKTSKVGMPVINKDGLIGFIDKTSKNVSEVNLLTNINEKKLISVLIMSDEKEISGVLKEYDSKKKLFKITDIIDRNEIKEGDSVVLSGYQSNYKGIYIGYVKKQENSDYGLTKTVWVKSNVNFNDIMYVIKVGEK